MSPGNRAEPAQTGVPGRPSGLLVVGLQASFDLGSQDDRWRSEAAALAVEADRDALDRPLSALDGGGQRAELPWQLGTFAESGRSRNRRVAVGALKEKQFADPLAVFPETWDSIVLDLWGIAKVQVHVKNFDQASSVGRIDARSQATAGSTMPLAARRLDRLRSLARCEAVLSGFVHVDSTHDPLPNVYRYNLRAVPATHAPGYYWAVLLTSGHIDLLGGVNAIERYAPVASVERIERSDPALLCVLTDSSDDITEERVLAWRQYLQPVLPWGIAAPAEDVGRSDRPLERPVWVFEGPPLPKRAALALSGQQPLGGASDPGPDLTIEYPAEPPSDPSDPEVARCAMGLGPSFDETAHGPTLLAIVDTWARLALSGEMRDLEGQIRRLAEAPEIHRPAPDGPATVTWAFAPGDADVKQALTVLHRALAAYDRAAGPGLIEHTIELGIA